MKTKIKQFFKKKFVKPVIEQQPQVEEFVAPIFFPLVTNLSPEKDYTLMTWIYGNDRWFHIKQTRYNNVLRTEIDSKPVSNETALMFGYTFECNEVQHTVKPIFCGEGTAPMIAGIIFH